MKRLSIILNIFIDLTHEVNGVPRAHYLSLDAVGGTAAVCERIKNEGYWTGFVAAMEKLGRLDEVLEKCLTEQQKQRLEQQKQRLQQQRLEQQQQLQQLQQEIPDITLPPEQSQQGADCDVDKISFNDFFGMCQQGTSQTFYDKLKDPACAEQVSKALFKVDYKGEAVPVLPGRGTLYLYNQKHRDEVLYQLIQYLSTNGNDGRLIVKHVPAKALSGIPTMWCKVYEKGKAGHDALNTFARELNGPQKQAIGNACLEAAGVEAPLQVLRRGRGEETGTESEEQVLAQLRKKLSISEQERLQQLEREEQSLKQQQEHLKLEEVPEFPLFVEPESILPFDENYKCQYTEMSFVKLYDTFAQNTNEIGNFRRELRTPKCVKLIKAHMFNIINELKDNHPAQNIFDYIMQELAKPGTDGVPLAQYISDSTLEGIQPGWCSIFKVSEKWTDFVLSLGSTKIGKLHENCRLRTGYRSKEFLLTEDFDLVPKAECEYTGLEPKEMFKKLEAMMKTNQVEGMKSFILELRNPDCVERIQPGVFDEDVFKEAVPEVVLRKTLRGGVLEKPLKLSLPR